MIVLDASAAVEILAGTPTGAIALAAIRGRHPVVVPANFDAEAFNGLRRLFVRRAMPRAALLEALDVLALFDAERLDVRSLLGAAGRLVDTFGGHDVFYVLLAMERTCPLVTCDLGLARAARSAGLEVIAIDRSRSA